ncbi:MAG: hypothetical protein ISS47_08600 [Candidatus Omnitrophica bacterium]|nr:hypothetical protein [Candidatus Omnitrophota bacterium]
MSKQQNPKKERKSKPKKYQRPTLTKYPALKQIMGAASATTAAPQIE